MIEFACVILHYAIHIKPRTHLARRMHSDRFDQVRPTSEVLQDIHGVDDIDDIKC